MVPSLPQGDRNIHYYEISANKPHLNYLMEYHSYNPQKGIGECGTRRPRGAWGDRDESAAGPALKAGRVNTLSRWELYLSYVGGSLEAHRKKPGRASWRRQDLRSQKGSRAWHGESMKVL